MGPHHRGPSRATRPGEQRQLGDQEPESIPPGERQALDRLSRLLRSPAPSGGEVWFGDDAAAVRATPESEEGWLLMAADAVVGGVDADLELTTLADLGWKAMAVNLSDIAAMGGRPRHALVSVVGLGPDQLEQLYQGILEASTEYACPVVGGDLSSGGAVVVSVAVTGWVDGPPVLRSGARPGDAIWVTGPLGAAAAGLRRLRARAAARPVALRPGAPKDEDGDEDEAEEALVRAHARPRPALAQGEAARRAGATAMIDVSDGLLADLGHVAVQSGVGFDLFDASRIPVAPGATAEEALVGGDDYVLAFTLPPELDATGIFAATGLPSPWAVGTCTDEPAQRTLAGRAVALAGWEHRL